jgi:hypothetical protein
MREQATRSAAEEALDGDLVAMADEAAAERYIEGEIPPVAIEGVPGRRAASPFEMAEDESENENVRELKAKIAELVAKQFAGDYKKAFEHYDADHDGGVNKTELITLLGDAGIGNGFTRGTWGKRIIERLDESQNGTIQWAEFDSVFTSKT